MSSLRNAVKRKTHKERPQPQSRSKFGLLERKKDYKARADDFHRKEKALQNLRRKAEERNPDEFYFAMEHARTKGGVHLKSATKPNKYSQEELRLMKGQDIGYLQVKRQSETKKAERMRESLHFIGAPVQNSHTLFVEEEAAASISLDEHFDTPAELLGRTYNRPRRSQLSTAAAVTGLAEGAADTRKLDRRRAGSYKQLLQRDERRGMLGNVLEKMALEKAVMGKGRKRKLGPTTDSEPPVYRWKQERKR
ncbi:probable U3 small nucleolar RNA-associated protein 11 [Coccomyxa sp. Obi]|nr:probable U3 small nucleolar RNA-associated protein 11 [Coccomyxa sp. Obi]